MVSAVMDYGQNFVVARGWTRWISGKEGNRGVTQGLRHLAWALVNKATFTKPKKKNKTNLKRTGQAERISCSTAERCKKALFYSDQWGCKVQCEVGEGRRTGGEAESAWRWGWDILWGPNIQNNTVETFRQVIKKKCSINSCIEMHKM